MRSRAAEEPRRTAIIDIDAHLEPGEKWLDAQGIAQQHVIRLAGIAYDLAISELADTYEEGGGRLKPVTALTLLLAEVGTGWLPFLHREIDDRISPVAELFTGKRTQPLKPCDYFARNVKATPRNGGNDSPLTKIMPELPDDMIVSSSDFPHFEGIADPIAYYAGALAPLLPRKRERFLGGSIDEAFRRMGDALL